MREDRHVRRRLRFARDRVAAASAGAPGDRAARGVPGVVRSRQRSGRARRDARRSCASTAGSSASAASPAVRSPLDVSLPPREVTIRVETVDARGRRAGRTVRNVLGLPRAARPRLRPPRLDERLQRQVRRLAAAFPGTPGRLRREPGHGPGGCVERPRDVPRRLDPQAGDRRRRTSRARAARPLAGSRSDRLLRGMLIGVGQRRREQRARLARRLDERRRQPRQHADALARARAHRDVRRVPHRHVARARPGAGRSRRSAGRRRRSRPGASGRRPPPSISRSSIARSGSRAPGSARSVDPGRASTRARRGTSSTCSRTRSRGASSGA